MRFRITIEKLNKQGEVEGHIYRNYEYEDMSEFQATEHTEKINDMVETLYDDKERF